MAKSTKIEVNHRVNTVYKLLSEGQSRSQIVLFCADNYGVSDRQSETYIARAREKLLADAEMERPAWVAEALQRLRVLEQKAAKKNQTQCAINSIALQAKLIGLDT